MGKKTLLWHSRPTPPQQQEQHYQKLGLSLWHAPVTSVRPADSAHKQALAWLNSHPYGACIITSANALGALASLPPATPLWTVGHASAAKASAQGFSSISTPARPSGAKALIEHMTQHASTTIPYLYLSAEQPRHDLPKLLQARGFHCDSLISYHTHPLDITETLTTQLTKLYGALIYSPATAKAVAKQLIKTGKHWQSLTFFCLSAECANTLKHYGAHNIHISQHPTAESLRECIKKVSLHSSSPKDC